LLRTKGVNDGAAVNDSTDLGTVGHAVLVLPGAIRVAPRVDVVAVPNELEFRLRERVADASNEFARRVPVAVCKDALQGNGACSDVGTVSD
jgi:hypothetical protein